MKEPELKKKRYICVDKEHSQHYFKFISLYSI